MSNRLVSPGFVLIHVVALHIAGAWFLSEDTPEPEPVRPEVVWPDPTAEAQASAMGTEVVQDKLDQAAPDAISRAGMPLPGHLDLAQVAEEDGRLVGDLGHGWTAELTTWPTLQKKAERILTRGRVPYGAIVMLDPKTGDVLAMADRLDPEHEAVPELDPEGPAHLALRAQAPAASVFKIITASALLEAGVRNGVAYCYTPARRRIDERHLAKPAEGSDCVSIADALAWSNNGWFARMAHRKFERATPLRKMARQFGFNRVIPFPVLTDASTAQVPDNGLERARMAAGFWRSTLTPLHGALIAAAVANDGLMPAPRLVARLRDPLDRPVDAPTQASLGQPLTRKQARLVAKMMRRTVEDGTGTRAFTHRRPAALDGIKVSGKTGSLTVREPKLTAYTWFVGYAPADDPQVAIAVLVGNGELWWVRAADVAQRALGAYFDVRSRRLAATAALEAR